VRLRADVALQRTFQTYYANHRPLTKLATYYALGYAKSDFDKPTIEIANDYSTVTPCAAVQPLASRSSFECCSALPGEAALPLFYRDCAPKRPDEPQLLMRHTLVRQPAWRLLP